MEQKKTYGTALIRPENKISLPSSLHLSPPQLKSLSHLPRRDLCKQPSGIAVQSSAMTAEQLSPLSRSWLETGSIAAPKQLGGEIVMFKFGPCMNGTYIVGNVSAKEVMSGGSLCRSRRVAVESTAFGEKRGAGEEYLHRSGGRYCCQPHNFGGGKNAKMGFTTPPTEKRLIRCIDNRGDCEGSDWGCGMESGAL